MALIGAIGEKQESLRVPDTAHDAIDDWPVSADGDKSTIPTGAHRAADHIFRRFATIFDCGFTAKCAAMDQRILFGRPAGIDPSETFASRTPMAGYG